VRGNYKLSIKPENREALLKAVFETSALGIALIGSGTGYFLDFNKRFCKITGLSGPRIEGRSFQSIFKPGLYNVDLQKLAAGELTRTSFETPFRRNDEKTQWLKIDLSGICEPGQKPGSLLAIFEDITERKQLENRLKRADLSLSAMPDAVFWTTMDGRIHDCNDAGCRMFGYSRHELTNMSISEIDENYTAETAAPIFQEIEQKGCAVLKRSLKSKSGHTFPAELTLNYTVLDGHKYVYCVVRDISRRVRAKKDAAFFRHMIELSRYPYCVMDPGDGWKVIYANKAACEHFGYSYNKLLSLRIADLDARVDVNMLPTRAIHDLTGETMRFETIHKTASGKSIPVEIILTLMEYDGKLLSFGHFYDISKRKAIEAELRESEEKLLEAQRLASVGTWVTDLSKNLLSASDECFKILGLPPNAPRSSLESFLDLVHPEDRERVRQAFDSIPDSLRQQLEFRIVRPDKAERMIRFSIETATDDLEQPELIIGAIQDITAQREAEEERLAMEHKLLQNQKLESLGVLAGGIAHDFNNILLAILGNLELALWEIPDRSKAHTRIERAIKSGRIASDLTAKLLVYAGKAPCMLKDTDLNNIIRANESLFASFVTENISLTITLGDDLPLINADHSQILQAIINLLINSSEAVGAGPGIITVSTGVQKFDEKTLRHSVLEYKPKEGLFVWVEVTDTGCGMDKKTQQKLFDPFFSTKFTGRGLGMPATLGIVRAHGGAVTVKSKPGRGASIRLLFPAKHTVTGSFPAAAKPAEHAADKAYGNTILVADDNEAVRDLCLAFIERQGLKTMGAADGAEALRLFKENMDSISLVILNMRMPKMDGLQVFTEIRKLRGDVPVLVSSGSSEAKIMMSFHEEKPDGFIQKPFLMKELLGRINQLLKTVTPDNRPK